MDAKLVIISNTRAKLVTSHSRLIAAVDKVTSFEHVGHEHARSFKRWMSSGGKAGWDGKTHLLTLGARTFPLGLLPLVERTLKEAGAKVHVVECREGTDLREALGLVQAGDRPSGRSRPGKRQGEALASSLAALRSRLRTILPGKTLREDQIDSVLACVERTRGILWAATGSGKTESAMALLRLLREHDYPGCYLFLSNRKKLLRDTHARFCEGLRDTAGSLWPQDVGFISEGEWNDDAPVIVGSVSTLSHKHNKKRLKKLLQRVTVLVVDECHHAASKSWYKLIMRVKARVRIGLSATPLDRGDAKNLVTIGALGDVIHEVRAKELVEAGILARPTVYVTPVRIPDELDEADYDTAYIEGVVNNLWRNRRIAQLVAKRKGKTLVLVQHIQHGRNIHDALRAAGLAPPAFLHGNTPSDVVDRTVKRFRSGAFPVLVASSIFREGVDIPETDGVVIADGGKSVIKVLQQLGRGTRRKDGANAVKVYDFADVINPHLARHSLKRIATYRREGFEIVFTA